MKYYLAWCAKENYGNVKIDDKQILKEALLKRYVLKDLKNNTSYWGVKVFDDGERKIINLVVTHLRYTINKKRYIEKTVEFSDECFYKKKREQAIMRGATNIKESRMLYERYMLSKKRIRKYYMEKGEE